MFGYEEAIGYAIGSLVRDKDGIGAGVVVAELAALEKERGRTLWMRLSDLYRRYGLYTSLQKSVVMPGADGVARIAAYMARLRKSPPDRFGGRPVIEWRDYAARTVVVRGETPAHSTYRPAMCSPTSSRMARGSSFDRAAPSPS